MSTTSEDNNPTPLSSQEAELSMLAKLQRKFTIPPPPKNLVDGAKRDYLLVGGAGLTAAMLGLGVWNHVRGGNSLTTTRFLRARIWAQAITVGIMGFYAYNYQQTIDDENRKKQKVVLT
ncbi:hypothetical protein SAMD00019534_119050 [Acytostelium subglobosum LB1]|uniref:hypothetical protein n=1 Tax=Acytostelium subglobosum LB1 TaxID=1410327 RepID=UPI000644D6AF|nr:hypothetical protein SAMD00019534_119050 [Acytostelium subglobosum LB1]GAM28729.1 hypothetical protein SAMD00019534_119050 [Acytostelium subglobosum LB1]|eukprot:XP_012748284.1 hypothetical protein SAMD00019534_119050 [Acytostelium subglobosum LB1]